MILDATAGPRGIWFDKYDEETVYIDIRATVKPDVVADSTRLPFKPGAFRLIVFDPPHVPTGPNSNMSKTYGSFNTQQILSLVSKGFREYHRVLENRGLVIFKWNTHDISLLRIRKYIDGFKWLFGQRTAMRTKHSSITYWCCLRRLNQLQQQLLT